MSLRDATESTLAAKKVTRKENEPQKDAPKKEGKGMEGVNEDTEIDTKTEKQPESRWGAVGNRIETYIVCLLGRDESSFGDSSPRGEGDR